MSLNFPEIPDSLDELDLYIKDYEEGITGIKKDARATIVWEEPANKKKTDYVLVYLHGFKASYGEGEPIHRLISKKFGFNLYLARLYKHGIDDPGAFQNIQSDHFTGSAAHVFRIAQKLGKKVIIMGTSTGGSLALYLASLASCRSSIAGLILYSPLVKFYGLKHMFLATRPGRALLRIVPGKNYMLTSPSTSPAEEKIWYNSYHLQGALALGKFVQQTMTQKTFSSVCCPVFVGYYHKNRSEQDNVVSVAAIRQMFRQLGTADRKKRLVNFPHAQTHVISSHLLSKSIEEIEQQTVLFLQNTMGLNPL